MATVKIAEATVYKKADYDSGDFTHPVTKLVYPNDIMIDLDEVAVIDRMVVVKTRPFNLFNDQIITTIEDNTLVALATTDMYAVTPVVAEAADGKTDPAKNANVSPYETTDAKATAGDSAYITLSYDEVIDEDTLETQNITGFIKVGLIENIMRLTGDQYLTVAGDKKGTISLPVPSLSTTSSAIVNADGSVWAWGENNYDKLNVARYDNQNYVYAPGVVMQDNNGETQFGDTTAQNYVKEFASGEGFSVALTADGSVWAWGSDEETRIGVGNQTSVKAFGSAQRVMNSAGVALSNIISVKAYTSHAVALDANGKVWAWGLDSDRIGQNKAKQNYYAKPLRISNVQAIAAGKNHTIALKHDGSVWAWGDNTKGQLGVTLDSFGDEITDTPLPVQAELPDGVKIVAITAGEDTSVALAEDGTVYTWGAAAGGSSAAPTAVTMDTKATQVDAKADMITATGLNSKAYEWKAGSSAAAVDGVEDVILTAAGGEHALALKSNGKAYTWGNNDSYQLGDSTNVSSTVPVEVNKAPDGLRVSKYTVGTQTTVDESKLVYEYNIPANSSLSIDGVRRYVPYRFNVLGFKHWEELETEDYTLEALDPGIVTVSGHTITPVAGRYGMTYIRIIDKKGDDIGFIKVNVIPKDAHNAPMLAAGTDFVVALNGYIHGVQTSIRRLIRRIRPQMTRNRISTHMIHRDRYTVSPARSR